MRFTILFLIGLTFIAFSKNDFNPQTDIDFNSLRFGDPEEVNYGRGCKLLKTEKSGKDMLVTFDGVGNGIMDDEFAAKLLGKTTAGKLLFGYARLPGINFIEPILSAKLPEIAQIDKGFNMRIEVQNFGQKVSKTSRIKIVYVLDNKETAIAEAAIPILKPWQKTNVSLSCGEIFKSGAAYNIVAIINPDSKMPAILHGEITPLK
jgi:hypothetical protein